MRVHSPLDIPPPYAAEENPTMPRMLAAGQNRAPSNGTSAIACASAQTALTPCASASNSLLWSNPDGLSSRFRKPQLRVRNLPVDSLRESPDAAGPPASVILKG